MNKHLIIGTTLVISVACLFASFYFFSYVRTDLFHLSDEITLFYVYSCIVATCSICITYLYQNELFSIKSLAYKLGLPSKEFKLNKVLVEYFQKMVSGIELRNNKLIGDKKKAEAENLAKTDFFSHITHELRTPMHAILNLAEMGSRQFKETEPEKLQHYFSRIEQSGDRLITLIDDILDLSKLEARKVKFDFSPFDLQYCLNGAISEMDVLLKKRNLTIQSRYNSKTTSLSADKHRIMQVLINLLYNAVKFSSENTTITITISDRSLATNDGTSYDAVEIRIADQGSGIPENELSTIFERFEQGDHPTEVKNVGTGLGLAICKQIVLNHYGKIWAENVEDGGAIFSFAIPVDCTTVAKTAEKANVEKTEAKQQPA